jgi:hypothetical protein
MGRTMEDIKKHKDLFEAIAEKYHLKNEQKAGEIADFLTTHPAGKTSVKAFSEKFGMSETEALVFLSFIDKGLRFKEMHMDKK